MTVQVASLLQQQNFADPPAVERWLDRFSTSLGRTSLAANEQRAVAEFLIALQQQYGGAIENVILYGSAARGEARVESDVDLMVLTRCALNQDEQAAIRTLIGQLQLTYGCVLSVLIMPPDEQRQHRRGSSLWRNIQRDGIPLWQTPQEPLRLDRGFLYRKNPASGGYVMTEAQYDEIRVYLEHSREELETAELLIQTGRERKAVSLCYYAVFYAASALLLTKGIIRARHGGVRSALSEHFIRYGAIPAALGDVYTLLKDEREMADYKLSVDPPWEAVAETRLEQARDFVETIQTYLIEHNFLTV